MSRFTYGGQAVIEGVMMRGKHHLAIAVRRTPEEIVLKTEPVNSWSQKLPMLKWPLIRGFVALIESLVMGVRALTYSANQVVEGEGEGETISPLEMFLSVAGAMLLGVGLFFLLPAALAHFLRGFITSTVWQNMAEGLIRIIFFLAYVWAISFMKDIQRVFQYHGAEHKTIYTYEAGRELTVDNARLYSTLHPRCGTNFLLVVMVISILVFSLVGQTDLLTRLLSRVILLPLVAGIAYEYIKLAAKYQNNKLLCLLNTPGLWLQKLTTREPDDSQLEVAITSLKAVFAAEEAEATQLQQAAVVTQ